MDHVEVLMRLHAQGGAPVSEADVVALTRLGAENVRTALRDLVRAQLALHDEKAHAFRYAPNEAGDRAAVDELATLYHQRPVTLVKLVYEQPPSAVTSFADAFRLMNGDKKP